MIPRPAQYLLRFDDLCPTMDRARWHRFGRWIDELALQPLLAVVPQNRDPELEAAPPDPAFWLWLRQLEARGAAIGLHGLTHLCESPSGGLLPLHRQTEFAGLPEAQQREAIRAGLAILRDEGLNPRAFVPPRHGFDRATLCALRAEGLPVLSDGFAQRAFLRGGVTLIPQQIWGPVEKSSGLWTICIHSNAAPDSLAAALEAFAGAHRAQFTSLDRILSTPATPLTPAEAVRARLRLLRVTTSKSLKRLLRR